VQLRPWQCARHDDGNALGAERFRVTAYRRELPRFISRRVAAQAGPTSQRYDVLLMIESVGELRVSEPRESRQPQQTTVRTFFWSIALPACVAC